MRVKLGMMASIIFFLLFSVGCGKKSWEPCVMNLSYTRNGNDLHEMNLFRTSPGIDLYSPTITIDEGETLKVQEFTCQLAEYTHNNPGDQLLFNEDRPPIPQDALDVEMRIRVLIRKHGCFDEEDVLVTDWVPVTSGIWKVRTPDHSWKIQPDWDYLKLEVETRRKGTEGVEGSELTSPASAFAPGFRFGLVPSEASKRTQWEYGRTIFGRLGNLWRSRGCPYRENSSMSIIEYIFCIGIIFLFTYVISIIVLILTAALDSLFKVRPYSKGERFEQTVYSIIVIYLLLSFITMLTTTAYQRNQGIGRLILFSVLGTILTYIAVAIFIRTVAGIYEKNGVNKDKGKKYNGSSLQRRNYRVIKIASIPLFIVMLLVPSIAANPVTQWLFQIIDWMRGLPDKGGDPEYFIGWLLAVIGWVIIMRQMFRAIAPPPAELIDNTEIKKVTPS